MYENEMEKSEQNLSDNQQMITAEEPQAVVDSQVITESQSIVEDIRQEEPETKGKKKEKREKKPSTFARFVGKTCKIIVSAAVFGLVAGGVFYGVNYVADKKMGTNVVIPREEKFEISTAGVPVLSDNAGKVVATSLGMDVSGLVESSMPAMVSVTGTVTVNYGLSPFFGGGRTETPTAGSGVIIGQKENELLIVTNAHVVEQVNNLKVSFVDGTTAEATVKGSKSNRDIAVITVKLADLSEETKNKIAIIEIGDSDKLQVGQPVVAIGNALGEGQSVTVGWVSSLNNNITIDGTSYEGLVRISAAINPGNSGGALLNPQGQLIGINSAKSIQSNVEGIGYAIPISSVKDIINDLMNRVNREKVENGKSGYLGISGIDITSEINAVYGWPMGVAISQVLEDSAAQKAGLVENDILVSLDGVDFTSLSDLQELLSYYRAGETVKIEYYRLAKGEFVLMSADITLGERK